MKSRHKYALSESADEAAFWQSPAKGTLWYSVRQWKSGPAWWYVAKHFWLKVIWPDIRILLLTAAVALVMFNIWFSFLK